MTDSLAAPFSECQLLLQRHAMVHAPEVGKASFTMHRLVAGLGEEDLRAQVRGANPIAWILWHLARVEDACIAGTVFGEPALLDDVWVARLGVEEWGDGEGMSREDAVALGQAVELGALQTYRNEVGVRTRELVSGLDAALWQAPLSDAEIAARVNQGALPASEADHFRTFTRSSLLWWWAVEHNHYHLGQVAMIRSASRSLA